MECRVCNDTGIVQAYESCTLAGIPAHLWRLCIVFIPPRRPVKSLCCQVCDTGAVADSDLECDPDIY